METNGPQLESQHLLLRLARQEDVVAIVRYYTEHQAYLAPFEPRKSPQFYTQAHWKREVKARVEEFATDRSLKLILFEKENFEAIVGTLNFTNFIRGAFHSCTVGYSIAEAKQGCGYMREALSIAIDYAFTELNLHRITAAYLPHNQRSGKLLKRLGFVVEGYARDYLRIDDCWQDHILTSRINTNWRSDF
ncbi:GNAT family N-acetyltransferase [Oscillatoriales cyanobacterium LEGE 11467]|uniref:GNAT family N-acetyltransferase n=1 Tax=Zarconia navalis LEGE 11467 TaxID=1828826 RepID=A0A928VXZ0_9CYAN|nr:GNAT family N-acetyltransferase [Zarconia navalis]MBE9041343.1 GNAT family N-acetyltransferase [Zarconia navalis LEGE 11467]